MAVAGPFFELHPWNLVRMHFYLSCKSAKIFVGLAQMAKDLAKISVSVLSISWGVLGLGHVPHLFLRKGQMKHPITFSSLPTPLKKNFLRKISRRTIWVNSMIMYAFDSWFMSDPFMGSKFWQSLESFFTARITTLVRAVVDVCSLLMLLKVIFQERMGINLNLPPKCFSYIWNYVLIIWLSLSLPLLFLGAFNNHMDILLLFYDHPPYLCRHFYVSNVEKLFRLTTHLIL